MIISYHSGNKRQLYIKKTFTTIMTKRKRNNSDYDLSGEGDKADTVYVGDAAFYPQPQNYDPEDWRYQIRMYQLEKRMNIIERALGPASIIKAVPAVSLVYMDNNCNKRVKTIYDNWIEYMGYAAEKFKEGMNVEQCFWAINRFIFEGVFDSKKIFFIPLPNNSVEVATPPSASDDRYRYNKRNGYHYDSNQWTIIKKALEKDRDPQHRLKNPSDKEYISTLVSGDKVYIVYFPSELSMEIQNQTPPTGRERGQEQRRTRSRPIPGDDIQLRTGSVSQGLCFSDSIVSELDSTAIGVKSDDDGKSLCSGILDKRLVVLGTRRPLYNGCIDTDTVDVFQANWHGMGMATLHLTLLLFHVMVHLKSDDDDNAGHSNKFLREFINYTPSVLFGHYMFPPLTIKNL